MVNEAGRRTQCSGAEARGRLVGGSPNPARMSLGTERRGMHVGWIAERFRVKRRSRLIEESRLFLWGHLAVRRPWPLQGRGLVDDDSERARVCQFRMDMLIHGGEGMRSSRPGLRGGLVEGCVFCRQQ